MTMKLVRLELARDHDFPNGSRDHGYEFVAPLDEEGHILPEEWHKVRDRCRVRRFWEGEPDEVGHLVRKPGGSWAFHYDLDGDVDDDEAGYRFQTHLFEPGEYVSIREQDDTLRTFRVVAVNELE
ncbi:hypothetical protein HW532_10460 [Kaustia mangrovi]|uniref:Uncharacterized protein n=1 Tax=Kaustia mangrovi TaxID=2593653 RepID=A0A7S8C4C0_9HYPH|nr:hypothetical protein [Kaustia mangrovi]QPC43072.1 hypothetical protein HW532_10460 [Kaustia mangrovi]